MDAMPISDGLPTNATEQMLPKASSTVVCYSPMMITTNGIWQGFNPLEFSLPLFILQTAIIVVTTRLLVLVLRPFRQPRVIAEILVRTPIPLCSPSCTARNAPRAAPVTMHACMYSCLCITRARRPACCWGRR